jgi:hypothetical protein
VDDVPGHPSNATDLSENIEALFLQLQLRSSRDSLSFMCRQEDEAQAGTYIIECNDQ